MLTAFGFRRALVGGFFDDLHFALHGGTPATTTNEIRGFAYERQPSPAWRLDPDPAQAFRARADVRFPVATGPWPPVLSVGLWRVVHPAGLMGTLTLERPLSVDRGQRMVLTEGDVLAALATQMGGGVGAPALRSMRDGASAAMARVTHASLHTGEPATEANELLATDGLDGAYADHAAGRPIAVSPGLLRTMRAIFDADPRLALGYARARVPGWSVPSAEGAINAAGVIEWPAPPVHPVLQWQSGGRGRAYPQQADLRWPAVVAVGLCEGAAGPVVAWTSRFALDRGRSCRGPVRRGRSGSPGCR